MTSRPEDIRTPGIAVSETMVWAHWGLEPKTRTLEVGSRSGRMRVTESGSGPPVLFVHGTGGYGPYWAPLVSELGGYHSFMLDRPGWGGSDPVDYPQSDYRDFVANLLVDVVDALGVEKVHTVGASIGDTWALALAKAYPERIHSVTLLGGGPLTDEVPVPSFIRLLRSPVGILMSRMRFREKMESGQARQAGHGPTLENGRMPQIYVDWKVSMTNDSDWRLNERAMVRALTDGRTWDPGLVFDTDELASVSVPVLMVYGTADPIASVETWQRFVAGMPDGKLELIEEAGHLPWFDEPERVSGLLIEHFQAADP